MDEIFEDSQSLKDILNEIKENNYDIIRPMNELFPTEESIVQIEQIKTKFEQKITESNRNIREIIFNNSNISFDSEKTLKDSRETVENFNKKLNDMKQHSETTKESVNKIVSEIEPLDRAKRNLISTLTLLKRLQMLYQTIISLEDNIRTYDYKNCAKNVLTISSFHEYFKEFDYIPQIKELLTKFYDLKRKLRNQVNMELEEKLFFENNPDLILTLCDVIDVYEEEFRITTIEWFCDKFLSCYDDSFEKTELSDVHSRYRWFKQRIDNYNQNYGNSFPKSWKMTYFLTLSFCNRTSRHLKNILSSKQPDTKTYLESFEMTIKFETKMADSFSTYEMVVIKPDDPIPDFPLTADGVKEKREYMRRREKGIPETRKNPASEFIGSIASAFSPYMKIYLDIEKSALQKIVQDSFMSISTDINEEEKIFNKSKSIISCMKQSIDKCAGFNDQKTLVNLFRTLKQLIVEYVTELSKQMPKNIYNMDKLKFSLTICNTTSMFYSIINSLVTKVLSLVTDEMSENVNVNDTIESIGNELKKQLLNVVDNLIKDVEPYIIITADINNRHTSSSVSPKLAEIFDTKFSMVTNWLFSENVTRIRITIIQKSVSLIYDSLHKTRGLTSSGASKALLLVKAYKDLLLNWSGYESTSTKNRIEFDFQKLEKDLNIISSPDAALVMTYLNVNKNRSKDHFMSLVKIKNLSQQAESKISREYDERVKDY